MLSAVLVSPFALLKSDPSRLTERLIDKEQMQNIQVEFLTLPSLCLYSVSVNQLVSRLQLLETLAGQSRRYLRTPPWLVVASLVSVHTV